MAWLFIVIPRSFSRSILSSICPSTICIVFVYSSSLSARVDLPWSICAMMQKFLIFFIQEFNVYYSVSLFTNSPLTFHKCKKIHGIWHYENANLQYFLFYIKFDTAYLLWIRIFFLIILFWRIPEASTKLIENTWSHFSRRKNPSFHIYIYTISFKQNIQ